MEGMAHEEVREVFTWGSYGKRGDEPLTVRPLKELSPDHIGSILRTQHQLSEERRMMFINELVWRLEARAAWS